MPPIRSHPGDALQLYASHHEHRLRIARAEGGEVAHPAMQRRIHPLQGHFEIQPQLVHRFPVPQIPAGHVPKPIGELVHVLPSHGQPGRHPVAPEALQQRLAFLESVEQVESLDRPAGTPSDVPVEGDDHGGPVRPLDQPRGDDADHARVPVVSPDHHRLITVPRPGASQLPDLVEHAGVHEAALRVLTLQVVREPLRLVRIGRQQEPQPGVGLGHPAHRVQTGRDAERDVLGLDPAVRPDPGIAEKSPEARLPTSLEGPQAGANQDPVLARQRHLVGHRAERDEVQVLVQGRRSRSRALVQYGDQLERHSDTGQVGERVPVAGQHRVHDGHCIGKPRTR